MSKVAEQHAKDGLVVLAVNAWDEPKKKVAAFVKKNKLKQTILLDGASVGEKYIFDGIPTVFFIDREGIVRDVESGFGGEASLHRKTKSLMRRGG